MRAHDSVSKVQLRGLGGVMLAACLLLVATPARATTTIPGGLVVNQTWTPANSPYYVSGDITVPAGATLTIQPGTVVTNAASDSQGSGLDTKRVEWNINGTLQLGGNATNPVVVQSETASVG